MKVGGIDSPVGGSQRQSLYRAPFLGKILTQQAANWLSALVGQFVQDKLCCGPIGTDDDNIEGSKPTGAKTHRGFFVASYPPAHRGWG